MKTQFDEVVTMHTLQAKYAAPGLTVDQVQSLVEDGSLQSKDSQGNSVPIDIDQLMSLKNVCAKVPAGLSDEIDRLAERLDISKREFIELALFEACQRASQIMDDLDIDLFYRESKA
jgi:hypothetical protein